MRLAILSMLKRLTLMFAVVALGLSTLSFAPTHSFAGPGLKGNASGSKSKGKGKVTSPSGSGGQPSTSRGAEAKPSKKKKKKAVGKKPASAKPTGTKTAENKRKKSRRKKRRNNNGEGTSGVNNGAGPSSAPVQGTPASAGTSAGPSQNRQAQLGGAANANNTLIDKGNIAKEARRETRDSGSAAPPIGGGSPITPGVAAINLPPSTVRSGELAQARRQNRTNRGTNLAFTAARPRGSVSTMSVQSNTSTASSVLTRAPLNNPWSGGQ